MCRPISYFCVTIPFAYEVGFAAGMRKYAACPVLHFPIIRLAIWSVIHFGAIYGRICGGRWLAASSTFGRLLQFILVTAKSGAVCLPVRKNDCDDTTLSLFPSSLSLGCCPIINLYLDQVVFRHVLRGVHQNVCDCRACGRSGQFE